jgi:uncharacterized Zn-finger protein
MEVLNGQTTICSYCNEEFTSKEKYRYHYRKVHQNQIKNYNLNEIDTQISRAEDQTFHCLCGKKYSIYPSLYRHQKHCHQWKDRESHQRHSIDSNDSEQGTFHLIVFVLIC